MKSKWSRRNEDSVIRSKARCNSIPDPRPAIHVQGECDRDQRSKAVKWTQEGETEKEILYGDWARGLAICQGKKAGTREEHVVFGEDEQKAVGRVQRKATRREAGMKKCTEAVGAKEMERRGNASREGRAERYTGSKLHDTRNADSMDKTPHGEYVADRTRSHDEKDVL
ncbi:hypothetical protein BKA62DRAFT_675968 [Auriculariales sp. MPI-PUGE-AT-0066]|nr:hypothetical protein BKA62DRAFT_675968 [Auriculariales sp. MPI-PUGE-AT-0066]